ncbi:hypothetical protein KKG05_05755, partial [bacterium]|nr:hypothetical protein [bacterium]
MKNSLILISLLLGGIHSAVLGEWIEANSSITGSTPTVDVRSQSASTWEMDFSIPGFVLESSVLEGDQLNLPGEMMVSDDAGIELPIISRVVALQMSGNPEIEILSEEWIELADAYHPALVANDEGTTDFYNLNSTRDEFFPEATFHVTPRQIMGGVSLAVVHVRAAKYNPVQNKIKVLKSAEILIHETGQMLSYDRPITETTAQALRAITPNWELMGLDAITVRGTLLYIVANNSTVPAELEELVTWRTRKGYTVEVAGPAQIGPMTTTYIKNYIFTRYNAADPPLEFVCLVGDAGGSYNIPAYFRGGGVGDWDYSRLDGNDLLPDVAVGRYCFDTIDALRVIVNKTYYYEREPAPPNGGTNSNWYKAGGCFVGSGSGISTVYTLRWVHERMLDAGYINADIDTVYYIYESVTENKITNSINSGVSLWCYRGYYHMESYDEYDINQLHNERRLPFMTTITCATNDFDDDSGLGAVCKNLLKAGTTSHPKGVIGVIGTSSISTHTRFNNCLLGGVIQGMLREGTYTTGGSLSRSKLELYRGYPTDSTDVAAFCHYESLLGDPAVDVFTDTPETLYVNNPRSLPLPTNTLTLTVTNGNGQPVTDAYVNLMKDSDVFVGNWTDEHGQVAFNFSTTSAGTLFVTASKHNCRPAINYSLVEARRRTVAPVSSAVSIDDDNNGESQGNGNGLAEPGETIELAVPLMNWGVLIAHGVIGILNSSDPFVASIQDGHETYGDIGSRKTVRPQDDFDFTIAEYAPDGYALQLMLTVEDVVDGWTGVVPVIVSNANLEYYSHTLSDVGNGILDPGESGHISFRLDNIGTRRTEEGMVAYLYSGNPAVIITDNISTFTTSSPGGQCNNQNDPFGITATDNAFPGERIPLTCIFPLTSGFADTFLLNLYIGSIASNAPTPPDGYGYWAFDNTDTAYAKHPVYDWVEIDPRRGGSGTSLNIFDVDSEDDMTVVVDLPFTFKYYGERYDEICVCSNGWIAMGAEQVVHATFRNWNIPGALGPSAMIAPFWDDLLVNPASEPNYTPPRNEDSKIAFDEPSLDRHLDDCVPDFQISVDCDGYTSPIRSTCGAGDDCETKVAEDHIYEIEILESAAYSFSLCSSPGGPSAWDSYLCLDDECCAVNHRTLNDDGCASGGLSVISNLTLTPRTYYLLIEGYYPDDCGNYELEIECRVSGSGVYAYHDTSNHCFIVEWSNVNKYDGSSPYPEETFECILYEPGYPQTPTGDSEILFQYKTCNNTQDVYSSNDFATVGIENLDETDGVLYSYFNRTSPAIPGAAPMTAARAILFTTQKLPSDVLPTPINLTAIRSGNDIRLRWSTTHQNSGENSSGVVRYEIYRDTSPFFTPNRSSYLSTTSDTTYLDKDALKSDKYFYVVKAVGLSPFSSA